jgi:hypothetical protein
MYAILCALDSSSIYRLRVTWTGLPKRYTAVGIPSHCVSTSLALSSTLSLLHLSFSEILTCSTLSRSQYVGSRSISVSISGTVSLSLVSMLYMLSCSLSLSLSLPITPLFPTNKYIQTLSLLFGTTNETTLHTRSSSVLIDALVYIFSLSSLSIHAFMSLFFHADAGQDEDDYVTRQELSLLSHSHQQSKVASGTFSGHIAH